MLLGADYNRGVKGLGKNKSLQLVQCEDPNFSMEFYDIFKDFNLEDLTSESLRKSRYRLFQKDYIYTARIILSSYLEEIILFY